MWGRILVLTYLQICSSHHPWRETYNVNQRIKKTGISVGSSPAQELHRCLAIDQNNCPNTESIAAPNLEPDVDRLIKINRQIRSKPSDFIRSPKDLAKSWPNELVVCWGAVFPESDWLLRMKHTLLASKPSCEPWIDVYQVGKQLQVDREVS